MSEPTNTIKVDKCVTCHGEIQYVEIFWIHSADHCTDCPRTGLPAVPAGEVRQRPRTPKDLTHAGDATFLVP